MTKAELLERLEKAKESMGDWEIVHGKADDALFAWLREDHPDVFKAIEALHPEEWWYA